MALLDHYQQQLDQLKQTGNLRQFTANEQQGAYIKIAGRNMLNLSSNDYLGLAANVQLREEFLDQQPIQRSYFSSSSSRLLTGNCAEYEQFEASLSQVFLGRAALLFNSGYHMNIGILPALSDSKTLILADKLVHASMIDGIRLSSAKYIRYRHNDLQHLTQLLEKYHDDTDIERIIVVTESIFSMDGDETNLTKLVQIKQYFNKVMLYVDEAHAIGVRGEQGLGCAEQYNVIKDIDFLVGTLGKACASVGGYLICDPIIRSYLINTMRPLIFSTALPPMNIAWSDFIFKKVMAANTERLHLHKISKYLQSEIVAKGYSSPSTSHIVPIMIGESQKAVEKSHSVQQQGFYAMPVRPPTVPQHSARLRVSLTSLIQPDDLQRLVACL
ncbi:8-amino-7-oxononanoate synthase [Acinetobacter guerrae]|uniref:8-amino-7-oxononanoate synthase n=1 Tax=Acinetobacter guerrae TaxID=1843371 RepID=UPI00128D4CF5|nr:8-amino-7-oxononanoate synthase [Acinetobacter guerrae]MPW43718.1 8-amino-7-oxononanoate synthase [Acinetobacter guerrae]